MQPDDPETIIGEGTGLGGQWCGCRQPRATPTFYSQPCELTVTRLSPRSAGGRQRSISSSSNRLLRQELGYLPLPNEAASALFQVVSQRYLKSSIVLTTNRPVGSWGEILGDTTVAAALLDRLLHRCVVLTLDGESYRLRDHHAAAETLRRAITATSR